MKLWVLAGLFTVAGAPLAAAAETDLECQIDDSRRMAQVRIDTDTQGGSAPAATPSAPAAARQAPQQQRATAEPTVRSEQQRRRNGKRIPDAELIGPRGAL